MLRVGLTGGLATGKSFVASILGDLGCYLLRADEVGHRLLRRGQAAYAPVLAQFGASILGADQEIDRAKLGALVFSDPKALEALNKIVHPAVFQYEKEWLREIEVRDANAIAIVEAAILIETGNYRSFDKIIVTWCPEDLQIERALARGNTTEASIRQRLARQLPGDEKKLFADFVIDTSHTLEATEEQTRDVYQKLVILEREAKRP